MASTSLAVILLMTITTCLGAESWAVDRSSFREALRGQSLEETFGQAENRYEDSYGGINVAPRGNLKTVPRMSFKDYSQQVVTNEDNYGGDGQSQAPGYAGQGNNRRGGASYGGSQSGSRKASGYGQAKISAGGYGSSSAYGSEPQYENLGLRAYGRPGQDFPTYEYVPETGFDCKSQSYPGYYADTGAQCQAFYICQADGRQDGFLCPNATLFNQELFVCDYWQNVDCSLAPSFYGLNGNLYRSDYGNKYNANPEYSKSAGATYGQTGNSYQQKGSSIVTGNNYGQGSVSSYGVGRRQGASAYGQAKKTARTSYTAPLIVQAREVDGANYRTASNSGRSSTGYTSPARVAFSTNQKDSYASSGSGQVESLLAAYQQQSADAVDDNSKNAQHIQHDVNESDNLGSDHGQDYSAENLQSQNGDGFADDGQEYGQRTSADQQAGVY